MKTFGERIIELIKFGLCIIFSIFLAIVIWCWIVFPFSKNWTWQLTGLYYTISAAVVFGIYAYFTIDWEN